MLEICLVSETKGLPMEDIGALFGDEVIINLARDGYGIEEDAKLTDDV
jgi:hypothetical protein